ncbi:unnamed protein product, partial [marine sediment metagenome]
MAYELPPLKYLPRELIPFDPYKAERLLYGKGVPIKYTQLI